MFTLKVPATTANLGPGFDMLGLALQLYDLYEFEESSTGFDYQMHGVDAAAFNIQSDQNNLVYRAFSKVFANLGFTPPGIRIHCHSSIPICRGMGSSAAAVVAGLVGANKIAGDPFDRKEILRLATEIEGHPDNVAPILWGGLVTSLLTQDHNIFYHKYSIRDETLRLVLAVPEFTLSTKKAREVLPESVPFEAALANLSRIPLLIAQLTNGNYQNLALLMEDTLHQPYRRGLIPGYHEVTQAAREAGAYATAISGAGPTILALAKDDLATQIGYAMVEGFEKAGISARWLELKIHNQILKW